MEAGEFSTNELIVLAGGVLGILGAFMPWFSVGGITPGTGIEWNRELIVFGCGFLVIGLLVIADWTDTTQKLTALIGLVALGTTGYTLLELIDVIGSTPLLDPEPGLFLSLVAGLLILAGAVRSQQDSAPEAGMYSHR